MRKKLISSEYLNEASVLFVWISTVMPWSISYSPLKGAGVSAVFVRFVIGEIRFIIGSSLPPQIMSILGGYELHAGEAMSQGYITWTVGSFVFAIVFSLSLLLFSYEQKVESILPLTVSTTIGGLLSLSGLIYVYNSYQFVTVGFPGVPIPIGAVFMILFGGILLQNPSSGSHSETSSTPS